MTSLLNGLLGNGSKDRETAEEMRAILHQMQLERARHEKLLETIRASAERLQQLGEPIAKAGSDVDAVTSRLGELQKRFEAMVQIATQYQTLDERADVLAQNQERTETKITQVLENAQRIGSEFSEMGQKIDRALALQDQLEAFLETDRPFQQLRGEAVTIRSQVESTGEHVSRLREQHERLMDAHKLAMSKMEALDRRRDDMGRSLADKERRVAGVEQAVRGMDGVQHTIDEVRREMAILKATADLVSQKTAALEAQREAVDRALAQSEHLDRAMRQIDVGVRQQQENERVLGALHEKIVAAKHLHETVVERSSAISELQRDIDDRTQATRQELAAMTDETKKTVERFDFERRGMESVTQRVADLRAALADCESRFKGLNESSLTVRDLTSQTKALATQLQGLAAEAGQVDDEMVKVQAIRRDLDTAGRAVSDIGAYTAQIQAAQPTVEAALRDLEQLRGANATVADALEQTQIAHAEITRVRESQSETRSWLTRVEQSIAQMREQAGRLQAMAPTIEFVEKQTQRIGESMSVIESQREFVEELQRRMADFETLSGQLDERGQQLQARMEAAEQQFVGLAAHAEDAERMTMTVATVASRLNEAGREAEAVRKAVDAITERSESVEALAERTKTLRKEIEQRQHAVAEVTKDLAKATELRQEAADAAQHLDDMVKELRGALSKTETRASDLSELSTQLEDRAADLMNVEKRLNVFEGRLTQWDKVDHDVTRSLEAIVARQGTVGALQADLDRMFTMAEQTAVDVREITAAHSEIEGSRELLKEVMGRLQEVRDTAGTLEERKRQMSKAEDRLARAEGLLADVGSSLDALQGQKTIVDQAVEKAGSLQFLLKQAEVAIEGLREERRTTGLVRSAVAVGHDDEYNDGEDEGGDEEMAKAA